MRSENRGQSIGLTGFSSIRFQTNPSPQGWFPSAFLLDKSAIKEPEKFKVIANYTAESEQELAAKKGEVSRDIETTPWCENWERE